MNPPLIRITPTYYEQEGLRYDRITEVIGATWPQPDLQDWRASMGKARANRDLRHGQHIGTIVDASITNILLGRSAKSPQTVEVRQSLRAFTDWQRLNPFSPVACQCPLLNREQLIGGTPDCLTLSEGFDWKTSARFSFTQLLQIDQYWRLAEQQGYELTRYRLVRFDKILGIWEERTLTQEGMEWNGQWMTREFLGQTFTTLLTLYRQWQYVTGQTSSLVVSSNGTSTEAA